MPASEVEAILAFNSSKVLLELGEGLQQLQEYLEPFQFF